MNFFFTYQYEAFCLSGILFSFFAVLSSIDLSSTGFSSPMNSEEGFFEGFKKPDLQSHLEKTMEEGDSTLGFAESEEEVLNEASEPRMQVVHDANWSPVEAERKESNS